MVRDDNMEKKYLFLLLLLLTVGFASVNTYLDLNGKVDMSLLESDLDVVFKEVLLNKEKSENTIIIENGKSFIYSADDLSKDNTTSNIDYVVMNKSHQYDVEVTVSCTTDYETYLNYNGAFDNQTLPLEKGILIEAGEVKSGNIIAELKSENTSEESLVLKCTLNYIPVSRETIVEDEEYLVTLDSGYEEKLSDIKVKYYEEYSRLPDLKRTNYKFLGWYTEEDTKVDNNSLVKIKGNHTLHAKWEKICEYDPGKEWKFDYTGSEQEFSVPCDGNYKLETWGAQGGTYNTTYYGGYGAYSIGETLLSKNINIFINVGGKGKLATIANTYNYSLAEGGYNGGGNTRVTMDTSSLMAAGAGGGATHIARTSGVLSTLSKNRDSILIVSGAGGGAFYTNRTTYGEMVKNSSGGSGGGISGGSKDYAYGGTQISGYSFGLGAPYNTAHTGGAGSGGGYYGGNFTLGSINIGSVSASLVGSGGSGYIGNPLLTNKVMYCYNCFASNEVSTKTISTTCTSSTPTANCAKQGNGYAKITYLG